jgi:ABC-2 type transport system ATP-binding protein
METVIETKALTKKFGDRAAVDGVDLHVPAGVAFGFLGPNVARSLHRKRRSLGSPSA